MIRATSTAADSAITESSGCSLTLPGVEGFTAWLSTLKIFHGPSTIAAQGTVTISGLAGGDLNIHFVQTPTSTSLVDLDFGTISLQASDLNIPITVTVPAILGGGETSILFEGGYF